MKQKIKMFLTVAAAGVLGAVLSWALLRDGSSAEVGSGKTVRRVVVARKGAKLYMTGVFEVEVRSITTAKPQKLYLDMADAKMLRGKRVLIVDDVISTGESLRALEMLVEKAGGVLVGKMAVLGEGEAMNRKDIIALQPLPLFNPDGTVKE